MQSHTTLPRVSALDGLRGVAVAGVLAYHCGFEWARGGFLGVSLFFTLSGFLITSLLLAERAATGGVSLGMFWARRARRLLPAALLALAGIVVFGATVATGSQLRALRGDVLAALGYVANWRFVFAGTSYGDLWSAPSPVQHFWSLAIEEQLYLVLPLVVAGALALGRGRRRAVALALGALLGLSALSMFLVHDQLRAYYGTDVRAAELLSGALFAVAVSARPLLGRDSLLVRRAGVGALALLLVAWSTTAQSDTRLFDGGLLVHAGLVVVVIAAAHSDGPVAAVLSMRALRWLGRVSYGAYLYHWPIFLWLTEARTGLSSVPLAAVRVGVSLAVAALSAELIEEPIRAGRRLTPRSARLALATTAASVAVSLVLVTATPPEPLVTVELFAATSRSDQPPPLVSFGATTPTTSATTPTSSTTPTTPTTVVAPGPGVVTPEVPRAPGEPLRVYIAGDSNAYILGPAIRTWAEEHNVQVWASGWFGCHIVPGGTTRWASLPPTHTAEICNSWRETRAREIAEINPHVVVVMYGSFDLLDRKWDGSDEWTHIGKPDFDRALKVNIDDMTDLFAAGGARVLWTTYPRVRTGIIDDVVPKVDFPEFAEYRVARLNTFIRAAVATRPFAGIIDLRRHMQLWPGGELDPARRPDGIHPSPREAVNVAEWLGDQVLSDVERR